MNVLYEKMIPKEPLEKFTSLCNVQDLLIGGPSFHQGAAIVKAYDVRANDAAQASPCLVNFHGGAAIGGTAEQANPFCARYAVMCKAVVINVEYRLAPEHKAPAGIDDGYAALKWVIANAEDLGIDPTRIAIIGESGGGYITAGVAMRLAERREGGLVRF